MRKRMTHLASMAVTALLALTACNEEAAVMTAPAEPQNPPVADNSGNVYITGDDFTWELGDGSEGDASSIHTVTRSQLVVDGNVAKFTWTPGDRVGILPDQGAQVWFEIPTPAEGEEPTNVATFDGGAWALKPTSDYAAYYPFVKDFDLDRTRVPVSYTGQAQAGNGSTGHLGAYDYQGARPSTTNGAGGVSFDFDHVGALVLLQFTVPTSGTVLTGVTLSADGAEFITEGTYDLTSAEGFPITATETSASMTIGLDYTTTVADETVTLYFLCAPIDLTGKTVSVSVAHGEEGETFNLMAEGKNLQAAGGYLMEAVPLNIVDATAMTADELNAAVAKALAVGETDIEVTLAPDAPAEMITAIRRAICDTEGVADGSIHLTLKGVTSIPGTTNWDGVAFGPRSAQWDENNVEIVSHEEVTQLASVNLPDVTEIGAQAFYICSNLTSITAPKVQSIGDWGLQGTAITSIDMPLLKEAGYSAFCSTALTEVSLPSLETAGTIVFGHCKQLRTVDLPKLQNLSQQLFTCCTSLVSVSAPAATSMGNGVFSDCSELVSITLQGVTELTYEAFAECTKLENITLGSVITSVKADLFGSDALSSNITLTLNPDQATAETLPASAGTNVAWAGFTWKEVKFATTE